MAGGRAHVSISYSPMKWGRVCFPPPPLHSGRGAAEGLFLILILFLLSTAIYADAEGSGKLDEDVTAHSVTTGNPLLARYDANCNGVIEKGELIAAINDYLYGEGDEAISKSDVFKLIDLYLFN